MPTRERESGRMSLRIRKLTPLETTKLMGFERKDYLALREISQSDAQIFHECGDSIIVTCLMGTFAKLLGFADEEITQKIEDYVETLTKENT